LSLSFFFGREEFQILVENFPLNQGKKTLQFDRKKTSIKKIEIRFDCYKSFACLQLGNLFVKLYNFFFFIDTELHFLYHSFWASWNLTKMRTGPNLSNHFHWRSQMLAVLLWIAKLVWQFCLPFSRKKEPLLRPLSMLARSKNRNKNSSNHLKEIFLKKGCSWPLKPVVYLQSPHPGLFSLNCKNKKSWKGEKYLQNPIFPLETKHKVWNKSSSFKKSQFFWNFLSRLYLAGAKIHSKKKIVVLGWKELSGPDKKDLK